MWMHYSYITKSPTNICNDNDDFNKCDILMSSIKNDNFNHNNASFSCFREKIACFSTNDCDELCNQQKLKIKYNKHMFQCVDNICQASNSYNNSSDVVNCEPDKDIHESMVQYKNNISYKQCISTMYDIWSDDGKLQPGVCDGGMLKRSDLNNNKSVKLNDCTCTNDRVLGFFKNYKPLVPRCINKSIIHLLEDFEPANPIN